MDPTAKVSGLECSAGGCTPCMPELVVEEPLEIRLNGIPYAVLMRTPGQEIELAAGFCFTEGLVDSASELLSIGFCPDAGSAAQNIVNVMVRDSHELAARLRTRTFEARSGCGLCGLTVLADLEKRLTRITSDLRVRAADFLVMKARMEERQELGQRSRGTHAAGLFRPDGSPLVVREDIGRHNALDRVIGYALLQGIDTAGCVAFLSSRLSFEMVLKAARARLPVVAAISAASSLAVALAQRVGCTLAGRVRDGTLVVYTHFERILSAPHS